MKQLVAIAVLLASAQVSAFWGWNDGSAYGDAYNGGLADAVGAGDAEADFSFDFNMTARFRGAGRADGEGYGYGAGRGYGYNAHVPYYGAPYGHLPPPQPVE